MFGKKRLLIAASGLTALGAAGAMVAGVTFGLFSATSPAQTQTFTAGTVTLAQPANAACSIGPINPGDSNASACTFTADYTGNLPAYIGVDITVTGTAASSVPAGYGYAAPTPAPLYDGTANGLSVTVKSGTTPFMSGQTVNGATLANGATVIDLLLSTTPDPSSSVGSPTAHTFTIGYSLPQAAQNQYQGATAVVSLTIHAVQSANNGSTTGCNAGSQCAGITAWS